MSKYNKRNPDNRVLYLNYSAVDPALTNEKCNFWHFRFDANADMKMNAITDVMAADKKLKKVYIIGQDYSFGKAVAAAAVRDRIDYTLFYRKLEQRSCVAPRDAGRFCLFGCHRFSLRIPFGESALTH